MPRCMATNTIWHRGTLTDKETVQPNWQQRKKKAWHDWSFPNTIPFLPTISLWGTQLETVTLQDGKKTTERIQQRSINAEWRCKGEPGATIYCLFQQRQGVAGETRRRKRWSKQKTEAGQHIPQPGPAESLFWKIILTRATSPDEARLNKRTKSLHAFLKCRSGWWQGTFVRGSLGCKKDGCFQSTLKKYF